MKVVVTTGAVRRAKLQSNRHQCQWCWLRALEADLGQLNIGLTSAWRKAASREDWRRMVDTKMLQRTAMKEGDQLTASVH